MKYSWRNHGKHVTEAGGAPFCCLFKSDFPNCLSPPGRPAQPLLWAPPRTHPRKRGPGFLAQRAERVSYLSPWTLCSTQTRPRGCPRCWLARPLVTEGNVGAEVWAPFPLPGLGERQARKPTKWQRRLDRWGGNGFLCFSSIARMEKIKAKQKKIAALQQPAGVLPTWPRA